MPPVLLPYLKANDHEIWWCHNMSKAPPENNETFDDVFMPSSCR